MSLNDWLKNGWLRLHDAVGAELRELLAVADRDLRDCQVRGLSDDWRFGIAYNAGLQLARSALHAAGYDVPKGESHHFRAIDSLRFTLALDAKTVDRFQVFRKKRSAGVYEAVGMITRADAQEMLALALDLRQAVETHLRAAHPNLFR